MFRFRHFVFFYLPLWIILDLTAGCTFAPTVHSPLSIDTMESTMPVPTDNPVLIVDAFCDKATYLPGQSAEISAVIRNDGHASFTGNLRADLRYLTTTVASAQIPVTVSAGRTITVTLVLQPPTQSFRGYGVDLAVVFGDDKEIAIRSTALDVLDHWSQAPRYGFFSDFGPDEIDVDQRAENLSRYHINVVQFYDWMWRHYKLLPPTEEFTDALGRRLSLRVVKEKIAQAHTRNMAALAYGAVYGAELEFYLNHEDWALYRVDGKPESLADLFYIMDITPGSPWNDQIINEFAKAVTELDFDGIHMDQYGFPKAARAGSGDGPVVDLTMVFPPLIDRTAATVAAAKPQAKPSGPGQVIFNNVNDWPTENTAPRDQAAVYIEVWPPHDYYSDLQTLIERARKFAERKKQVILAAYMTPLCLTKDLSSKIDEAEEGTVMTNAVITANGGFHLLFGEANGALCDPYYPNYATLRPSFAQVMRTYADFGVRYENWLADPRFVLMPKEAIGPDRTVQLGSNDYGAQPQQGKIWVIARTKSDAMTLSLINLVGKHNTLWNALHDPSVPLSDIPVTLKIDRRVAAVILASPDRDDGRPQPLSFVVDGNLLSFTVPFLQRWDLIVISFEQS